MTRVTKISPTRLVLTDAPNLWLVGPVVGFFLLATVVVWAVSGTLGGFGLDFAVLWTAFFVGSFGQFTWSTATFDADAGTLKTELGRLYWRPRCVHHDLSQLDAVTWDQIALWSRFIKPKDDPNRARARLPIRREGANSAQTVQTPASDHPFGFEILPAKMPKAQADAVIRTWLAQARKA